MYKTKQINVSFTEISDCFFPHSWLENLSEEKYYKINNLKNDQERCLSITAHRLLCYILKSKYSFLPSVEDWAYSWHGKPYLKTNPDIHFNISHSGNIAMCAVHNMPVGIDIEKKQSIDQGTELCFMSEQELEVYKASLDKVDTFYKIWTLKEAYVKYCGRGIGSDIDKLTIYPKDGTIFSNVLECNFDLIDINAAEYQAAICASTVNYLVEKIEAQSLISF